MPSFSIWNFGCRATQADAVAMERALQVRGYTRVNEPHSADFVVLNTCTVTAAADGEAREAIRKIYSSNPAARIVVTGCYAQRAPEEIASLPGVSLVVGNSHVAQLPDAANELFSSVPEVRPINGFFPLESLVGGAMSLERGPAKILTGDIFAQAPEFAEPGAFGKNDRTRPTLKIQDGCNNRCSYCVIPFVRGRSRSLAPNRVVEEVRILVRAGAKEVVLSGIHLGSYGRDLAPRTSFEAIVRRILDETPLDCLRLSSIEPMDVTQDLVNLVAASKRIAPHFHMPLQSGSDRILRAMHRWYRAEHYARRVEIIHEKLPLAGLGADVIAGFPGETDEDFEATRDFIAALPFTYLHVFSFSPRPGTPAAPLSNAVPPRVIRERARELRALAAQKSAAFRAAHTGRALRVLTLSRWGDGWTDALSGNYLKLRLAGLWPENVWLEVLLPEDEHKLAQPAL